MAFTNRLALISRGSGVPLTNDSLFLSAGNTLTDGANTITLASLAPTVRSGWFRVKCYNGTGTSPAVTAMVVTATDGTTTETIYHPQSGGSHGALHHSMGGLNRPLPARHQRQLVLLRHHHDWNGRGRKGRRRDRAVFVAS